MIDTPNRVKTPDDMSNWFKLAIEILASLADPLELKFIRYEVRPNEFQPYRNGPILEFLGKEIFLDCTTTESSISPMGDLVAKEFYYSEFFPILKETYEMYQLDILDKK